MIKVEPTHVFFRWRSDIEFLTSSHRHKQNAQRQHIHTVVIKNSQAFQHLITSIHIREGKKTAYKF